MRESITRAAALAALRKYNHEPFHIQHALTVEGVMRWYAQQLGYGDEADFWATVGLLHDIDFEQWPEQHCQKAPELLREAGCGDDLIRAVCSHGYGICCDIEPTHQMEKVLYAADELTGLIVLLGPPFIGSRARVEPRHFERRLFLRGRSRSRLLFLSVITAAGDHHADRRCSKRQSMTSFHK